MSRNQRTPAPMIALDLHFRLRNKAKYNDMVMNIKAFATTMIEEVLGTECDLPQISVKAIRGEDRVTLAMPRAYADAINKFAPSGSVTLPDGPEGDSELTIKTASKESNGNIIDDGMSGTWWAHAETDIALGIPLPAYQEALDHRLPQLWILVGRAGETGTRQEYRHGDQFTPRLIPTLRRARLPSPERHALLEDGPPGTGRPEGKDHLLGGMVHHHARARLLPSRKGPMPVQLQQRQKTPGDAHRGGQRGGPLQGKAEETETGTADESEWLSWYKKAAVRFRDMLRAAHNLGLVIEPLAEQGDSPGARVREASWPASRVSRPAALLAARIQRAPSPPRPRAPAPFCARRQPT